MIAFNYDITDSSLYDNLHNLREIRRDAMVLLERIKPGTGKLWCTIKHLLLAQMHALELIERSEFKDTELPSLISRIYLIIDKMFQELDRVKDFKDCPRCENDMS